MFSTLKDEIDITPGLDSASQTLHEFDDEETHFSKVFGSLLVLSQTEITVLPSVPDKTALLEKFSKLTSNRRELVTFDNTMFGIKTSFGRTELFEWCRNHTCSHKSEWRDFVHQQERNIAEWKECFPDAFSEEIRRIIYSSKEKYKDFINLLSDMEIIGIIRTEGREDVDYLMKMSFQKLCNNPQNLKETLWEQLIRIFSLEQMNVIQQLMRRVVALSPDSLTYQSLQSRHEKAKSALSNILADQSERIDRSYLLHILETLEDTHLNLKIIQFEGHDPLEYLMLKGKVKSFLGEKFKFLLTAGAEIKDSGRLLCIYFANEINDLDLLQEILKQHTNINTILPNGKNIFQLITNKNKIFKQPREWIRMVTFLVKEGLNLEKLRNKEIVDEIFAAAKEFYDNRFNIFIEPLIIFELLTFLKGDTFRNVFIPEQLSEFSSLLKPEKQRWFYATSEIKGGMDAKTEYKPPAKKESVSLFSRTSSSLHDTRIDKSKHEEKLIPVTSKQLAAFLGVSCSLRHLYLNHYLFEISPLPTFSMLQSYETKLKSIGITEVQAIPPATLLEGMVQIPAKLEYIGLLTNAIDKLNSNLLHISRATP